MHTKITQTHPLRPNLPHYRHKCCLIVELKWENKVLRVPNPEHVRQLARTCAQQAQDLQQLKDRQISMQQQIAQLQRVVQQLQNNQVG